MMNSLPPEIYESWPRIPRHRRCWLVYRARFELLHPPASPQALRFILIHALVGFLFLFILPAHPVSIMGAWSFGFIAAALAK